MTPSVGTDRRTGEADGFPFYLPLVYPEKLKSQIGLRSESKKSDSGGRKLGFFTSRKGGPDRGRAVPDNRRNEVALRSHHCVNRWRQGDPISDIGRMLRRRFGRAKIRRRIEVLPARFQERNVEVALRETIRGALFVDGQELSRREDRSLGVTTSSGPQQESGTPGRQRGLRPRQPATGRCEGGRTRLLDP